MMEPDFQPHPLLRNRHAMTIVNNFLWRRFPVLDQAPCESRMIEVGEESKVLIQCHWQKDRSNHPTALLVHGLEGSADRAYSKGTGEKAWQAGFNVVRMNVRNCGDTEHLSTTLYDMGLSRDLGTVGMILDAELGHPVPGIFLIGFSMGGNQALKYAGEMGEQAPSWLKGLVAVSPPIELAPCADSIHQGFNRIYEKRFLFSLLRRIRRKNRLFPGRFDLSKIHTIQSLRNYDDIFVGPYQGYGTADQYYFKASAMRVMDRIRVPTLIVQAKDDPLVPVDFLRQPCVKDNPFIQILLAARGGHVGFVEGGGPRPEHRRNEDRFWAENRAVEFCRTVADSPQPHASARIEEQISR
ncbi:MAG: alpha/beta fold hydrolase [Acidobacteriia bacterium]|nr:alpha/beta fold hydrolase [Terriglobia bacterium]